MTDMRGERGEKGDLGQQGYPGTGTKGATGPTGKTGKTGVRGRRGQDTNNPAVWALAFVLVLTFTLVAIATHRNETAIKDANRALCALKQNDVDSLKATKRVLAANPNGPVVLAGVTFSHKELVSDEKKLEAHIVAYKDVACG